MIKNQTAKDPIDFVITWVDGNDPAWKKEKKKYTVSREDLSDIDDREERYRDWENLQYWFRGVEKFAPWVRTVHFVTWGHLPKWLNTSHPKLHIVKHTDYIPEKYLPTFNSHTIEWFLHRIPGLSEHFVYFNDDVFLLKPLCPEDFFQNGRPRDMLALQPVVANTDNDVMPYIYLNNSMVLARHFDKRENIRRQPWAYFHPGYPLLYFCYNFLELAFPKFTGFYTVHGPSPLLKDTYETLWHLEPELLQEVCSHRFRQKEDISQYVLREYQKLSGNFVPSNLHRLCGYCEISDDNQKLLHTIRTQKYKILCVNDGNHAFDFDRAKASINQAFSLILPEKSSFEL